MVEHVRMYIGCSGDGDDGNVGYGSVSGDGGVGGT